MSQIYFRCHSASCPRVHISCFVCTLNTNVMSNNPPFFLPPFKKNIRKLQNNNFWVLVMLLAFAAESRTHTDMHAPASLQALKGESTAALAWLHTHAQNPSSLIRELSHGALHSAPRQSLNHSPPPPRENSRCH